MAYLTINNFGGGLNTLVDPRNLMPNKDNEGMAETPNSENMDITKEGALVTATGYEVVSSIASTGGIKNLLNYEKDDDESYLIITHGTKHYAIDSTDATWDDSWLGTYGTEANYAGGVVYMGTSAIRRAILGNDISANATQKADVDHPMAALAGTPPDGYIMAVFMGRLFIAVGVTLYYSNVEDEDDFAGGGEVKFNDIITGLKVSGQRMTVFTKSFNQGVTFQYDDTWNISTPLKEPFERPYGCLAPKTVDMVYANCTYWADEGVMALGAEEGFDDTGMPRPQSMSRKIDPTLEFANKAYRKGACAKQHKQQYFLSIPYGTDTFNSRTFVYNLNWKSWMLRTGIYPTCFELFRDTNYKQELYFGNYFASELCKFNDSYSYNGDGYRKFWTSKKFTHGDANVMKAWEWIDITGSMDASTEIIVTIQVDNDRKSYIIDNTHLEVDSFGEYIGDNFLGDAYLGGSEPSESRFKRFRCRIPIDASLKEGYEMQLTVENDEPEQPFKINFIGIEYGYQPRQKVPPKYINNHPIA